MKKTAIFGLGSALVLALSACGGAESDPQATTEAPAQTQEVTEEAAPEEEETTEAPAPEDLPTVEPGLDEEDMYTAWTVELDGTTYAVDMGALPTGSTFAAFGYQAPVIITVGAEAPEGVEEYRQRMGVPEVGYIRIDADNREGITDIGMSDIEVYDEEGNIYRYESAFIPIGDWGPDWTGEYNEETGEYELADGTWISEEEYDSQNETGNILYDEHLENDIPVRAKGTFYMIGDPIPEVTVMTGVSYVDALVPGGAFPAAPVN